MKRVHTLVAAAALFTTTLGITGCQSAGGAGGSGATVASVNGENITEKQFFDKVQLVSAFNLAPAIEGGPAGGLPGRAGEYALHQLVSDIIIFQAAKTKNAMPSDEMITKYVEFAKKYQGNPQATMVAPDAFRSEETWREDVRRTLAYRGLTMSHVKINEEDLKKEYEKNKALLKEQNTYHLRLVDSLTESKAREALAALNKGIAFETVALKHSDDTISAPRGGDVGTVPENYLRNMVPGILAAAQKLKPNEYHKSIVKQEVGQSPDAQSPPVKRMHYYVVQLVEKKEGRMPTFDETRYLLENDRLLNREPGAFQKARDDVRQATEKAKIEINLPQYKEVGQRIKQMAAGAPPPGAAAPGAASPAAPRPAPPALPPATAPR